jgi:hypothetical protein
MAREWLTSDFNDTAALIAVGMFDDIIQNFDQCDLNFPLICCAELPWIETMKQGLHCLTGAKITACIPQQQFTCAGCADASSIVPKTRSF